MKLIFYQNNTSVLNIVGKFIFHLNLLNQVIFFLKIKHILSLLKNYLGYPICYDNIQINIQQTILNYSLYYFCVTFDRFKFHQKHSFLC